MDRDITRKLNEWKSSPFRKPLILKGARQVGKTWALRDFGQSQYSNVVYLSLEKITPEIPSEYAQFFETTKDPHRIIENLSLVSGQPIVPDKTLLILDEIQDCPAAIGSLKYFCEEAPQYHVACAGSLLGVDLAREASFPVGKTDFLQQYPMTFSEYLRASDSPHLDVYCKQIEAIEPLPDAFTNPLTEKLHGYFAVGGMPEAVSRWMKTKDIEQVQEVLLALNDGYDRDFSKHGGKYQYPKISRVWNSLPSQMSRENKKFLYGLVREGARAREYEDAIQWLVRASLIYRIPLASAPGIPLSSYDEPDVFKVYCLDIGVLRRLARLSPSIFTEGNAIFKEFKGAFAENYVLQALLPQLDVQPRYWINAKPKHEVDYLIQIENTIVPAEVKSGENVKSASLRYYSKKYADKTPLRVRFSLKNLSLDDDLLNIPLYLADEASRLIDIALEKRSTSE